MSAIIFFVVRLEKVCDVIRFAMSCFQCVCVFNQYPEVTTRKSPLNRGLDTPLINGTRLLWLIGVTRGVHLILLF